MPGCHTQVRHTWLRTYKLRLVAQGSLTRASATQCGLQLEEEEEGVSSMNQGKDKGRRVERGRAAEPSERRWYPEEDEEEEEAAPMRQSQSEPVMSQSDHRGSSQGLRPSKCTSFKIRIL